MKLIFKKLLTEHKEHIQEFLKCQLEIIIPEELEVLDMFFKEALDEKLNRKLVIIMEYMMELMDERLINLFEGLTFEKTGSSAQSKTVKTYFPNKKQIINANLKHISHRNKNWVKMKGNNFKKI